MTETYEIEFQITWRELHDLHRRLPNLRVSQILILLMGIGLLTTSAVLWFQQPDKGPIAAFWGGVFVALSAVLPVLAATGAWIQERRSLVLRLTVDSICIPAFPRPNTISWKHFNRFIETPRIVAAIRGFTKQYIVIPKRALHGDLTVSRVRELMSRAVDH